MGADAFVAFYGLKIPLDPDDEDALDACGLGTDPRCVRAERAGLDHYAGRATDGEDYFLYVGARLGWLGVEHDAYARVAPDRFDALAARTDARLAEAGFDGPPALHLQLEAQY